MRIIAGSARRVRLEVADGSSTRPFLEMARGALFNSLAPLLPGARVLDLFAGSGALGLEALSRGAGSCLFVERDPVAARALERNVAACRLDAPVDIRRDDAARAAALLEDEAFDLVFVDPPFTDLPAWRPGGAAEALMRDAARALDPDGLLVFRLEDGKAQPPDWPGLAPAAERRYGRSRICRYRKAPAGDRP